VNENEIAREIVDAAFHIHKRLGPGLLESVYEALLAHELTNRGLTVARQQAIALNYDGLHFDEGFRADLVVEDAVIVELKATVHEHDVYQRQLLTYLKVAEKRLGLLINFGRPTIKEGIVRIANGMPD
jgi:GxxExxY protein